MDNITFEAVNCLPDLPIATLNDGWGVWGELDITSAIAVIVKLVKMSSRYGQATGSCSSYALSDEIDEPGAKAFFLVELWNRYNSSFYWLTDDPARFWQVSNVAGFHGMPSVREDYYVVLDHLYEINFEEHRIAQRAIERYSEEVSDWRRSRPLVVPLRKRLRKR